eukprot:maker-scaffold60_size442463-snap-gene-3.28 protein:Tk12084 transcript:maker-scaffold60_size442463-snap-gene-3.28-mRNA-1 annotation:"CheB methylesterase"
MADLVTFIGAQDNQMSGYADDQALWSVGVTVDDVRNRLEVLAERFAAFANINGLVLNAGKTQIMIGGKAPEKELVNASVNIGGHDVKPSNIKPQINEDSPVSPPVKEMQIALNDAARTITGLRRQDHVKIADLMGRANLASINQLPISINSHQPHNPPRKRHKMAVIQYWVLCLSLGAALGAPARGKVVIEGLNNYILTQSIDQNVVNVLNQISASIGAQKSGRSEQQSVDADITITDVNNFILTQSIDQNIVNVLNQAVLNLSNHAQDAGEIDLVANVEGEAAPKGSSLLIRGLNNYIMTQTIDQNHNNVANNLDIAQV